MVGLKKAREEDFSDPILTNYVKEDKVIWYKKRNLRMLYIAMYPACMGIEITSGFDSQIINVVQIIPPWRQYFGDPTGEIIDGKMQYAVEANLRGFLGASYSLGAILSLPFVPWVNQRYGRRFSIMFGSICSVIGAFLQGFSNGTAMYIIARILLGFGIPFCIISGSAMLGELAYPKERAIMTSLFNASYGIGQVIAAAVGLGTVTIANDWGWRIPSLLQVAPAMVQIIFIYMCPESPRWLCSKDRHQEAFEILVKYHAEGDRDSAFVKAEMAQIKSTLEIEMEGAKESWLDIFKQAGMRRRLFISAFLGLFTQWSGNTLISYYLSDLLDLVGITNGSVKSRINVGIACWGLGVSTIVALIVPRFRRRPIYLLTASSLLVVYIAWTISMERYMSTETQAAAILTIFFIFMYTPAYVMGYNALTYTYLVELYPYHHRSRGIAWFQFFGRGASFFATYVNPIGLDNIQWRWLIVYVCWLAFEIVFIYFFFPETANRTLEELTFMFEGKEKADRVNMAIEKQVHNDDMGPDSLKKEVTQDGQVENVQVDTKTDTKSAV